MASFLDWVQQMLGGQGNAAPTQTDDALGQLQSRLAADDQVQTPPQTWPWDLSKLTGMPSALEQSAAASATNPWQPGMTAGQMLAGRPDDPLAGSFQPGIGIAAERVLASRSQMLYNPWVKPPRSFEADYPAGVPSDAAGRLTQDIEGRPLSVSARVVGRQDVGGADVALSPEEAQSIGEGSVGAGYQSGPGRSLRLGSDAGRLVVGRDPATGAPSYQVLINSDYPNTAGKTLQHETGHIIDEVAGQISTKGLVRDLRRLYNTLNTGQERKLHLTGPEQFRYSADEVPRELMAEAIRAYMADPNSLKTVAPKVAASIRAAVNTNPVLSPYIQFNSLAALLAGGGLLGAGQGEAP